MSAGVSIRPMTASDAEAVLAIYQAGIDTGNATFSSSAGNWEEWNSQFLDACRLVATKEEAVIGWAALSGASGRCVFSGVAEISFYVAPSARGQGVGGSLLSQLIKASEEHGFWTLVGEAFAENTGSLRSLEKQGFERLGVRKGLGKMSFGPHAGEWRDVVFYERRSKTVGQD